jgi:predicted membrane protein
MKLLKWLAPSMQSADGKASARALTNFWYVALNTAVTICAVKLAFIIVGQPNPTSEAIQALKIIVGLTIIYNITILIIFGIVSLQQVNEGIRAFRGQPERQEPIKVGDEITVTGKIEQP